MAKRLHDVDGRLMTVDEIAAMLGQTVHAVQVRRSNMGGISYQRLADMYRANQFQTNADRWPRHMVDGKWVTQAEAAAMVGVKVSSLREWRRLHRHPDGSQGTVQEAVDWFRQYKTGERRRYKGSRPRVYMVRGRRITVQQAADKCGVSIHAIRCRMYKGQSLGQAMKRAEEYKRRRAEREILAILNGKI